MTTMTIMNSASTTGGKRQRGVRGPGGRCLARAFGRPALLAGVAALLTACSLDSILKSDELPPDVTDPAITQSSEGAIAAYYGTIGQFRGAFGGIVSPVESTFPAISGLLSDELQLGGSRLGNQSSPADARSMPEGLDDARIASAYSQLQRVRGQASQSIGLLTRYAPDEQALAGHAYAMQGYAELFLAELFCSGIPLSTLDYDGDFTYAAGSTTRDVYRHALVLFDSARVLGADSARFVLMAQLGRARALLGLGELADAAAAVADVPDDYEYAMTFSTASNANALSFTRIPAFSAGRWELSVADREGLNGLDYRTSGDPRTTSQATATNQWGATIYHPAKYDTDGTTPMVLASGVEARLIEAEADLAGGGGAWLATLNALRTDGSFTTQPDPDDPMAIDTSWNAGSGGVAGLAPLEDPGTPEGRVDLVFRERAFWLFLTGHRQGDLRRLIRQYGRSQQEIYPVGLYPAAGGISYGSDVTAPIPAAERVSNPYFTGCVSRGA